MAVSKPPTLKQQVRELIDRLPDHCTAEDIQYEIYLLEKIRRGEESLKQGGIDHKEVRRRAAAWGAK